MTKRAGNRYRAFGRESHGRRSLPISSASPIVSSMGQYIVASADVLGRGAARADLMAKMSIGLANDLPRPTLLATDKKSLRLRSRIRRHRQLM